MTTSGRDHDAVRLDLAAYVLGALTPADRSTVARHVAVCEPCRSELADLAPMPALLGRLQGEDVGQPEAVAPAPDEVAERAIATLVRRRRRRLRRAVAGVTGGVVAVALVVAAVAGLTATRAAPSGAVEPDLALAAAAPTANTAGDRDSGPTGTAAVSARAWGMVVDVDLAGLPGAPGFVLWAVDGDGTRAYAASWQATDDGTVRLSGSCYMDVADLDRLEVETAGEELVLTLVPNP